MLASIPLISPLFQILLNSIGWMLAEIYRFVPNYGVSIVLLTLVIRFALLPLGIKQIKSMQHMQAMAPKIKELQKKYKGNKAKAQEEQMKLYKEAGVSPFGGCLPLLATFPFLIAMYSVIRMPVLEPYLDSATPSAYVVHNNHLPVDSKLFHDVITHEHTDLGPMNLQCTPSQSGTTAVLQDSKKNPLVTGLPLRDGRTILNNDEKQTPVLEGVSTSGTLDCGKGVSDKIPFFLLLALMVGTTYYQQRQMQRASPPGAASGQQQAILKFMPFMFGIFGFAFPGGLILYWTVANFFQISQQSLLLRAGHIGPEALERRIAEQKAKQLAAGDRPPAKKGFLAKMMEQAETQRQAGGGRPTPRGGTRGAAPKGGGAKGGTGSKGGRTGGASGAKGGAAGGATKAEGASGAQPRPQGPRRKPNTGGRAGGPKKRPGGGAGGGGDGGSRS
jgi:YidC/Oxa1 family membrane protein insertase